MSLKMKWFVALFFIALQFSWAQERVVSGVVKDAAGHPLPGVSVVEKGTTNGVESDIDGNYSIKVAQGKTLVFSYIGLKTQEIKVGTNSKVNIVLQEDAQEIGEVVVTGTGVATSKKKVAIAVQSVNSETLGTTKITSVDQALSGKIAGAQINSISGQPGQQASILLRAINSLGSTQPMILVDGVQVSTMSSNNGTGATSSRLADLDLSNVERVEVIQGAAAGTMYGAQGANGVIQIFTKKGKQGKVSIGVNSRVGFDSVLRGNLTLADHHRYETDADGYILNGAGARVSHDVNGIWDEPSIPQMSGTLLIDKPYKEKTYDNLGAFFKENAITRSNSVNISGASDVVDASLNLSENRQESVINGFYHRKNASLNLGFQPFKKLKLRSNTQFVTSTNTAGVVVGRSSVLSGLSTALNYLPYHDLIFKTPQGYYVAAPEKTNITNPFYGYQFKSNEAKVFRIVQSFNANYTFNKFLEVDYKYGVDSHRYDYDELIANQELHPNPSSSLTPIKGKIVYDRDTETLVNSVFTAYVRTNFEEDFGWKVPIQTTTQFSYDYRNRHYKNVTTTGSDFSRFPPYNMNTAATKSATEDTTEFVTFGYLINQKIDYGTLFGLSAGVRVDYSSAFGAGSKPFTFPRGDVYFRPVEFINADFLTEFKVRAAYGEAGIQPGAYDRFVTLESTALGTSTMLYMPNTAANPDLGVQVSKETEFGVDLGFKAGETWFSRINLGATYWLRKSEDVIRVLDLAPSAGTKELRDNSLTFSSKGIEASLDLDVYNSENFRWNLGTRFGKSVTKVDKIKNGKDIVLNTNGGQFVIREGENLGAFFGVKTISSVDARNANNDFYIPAAAQADYESVDGIVVNKNTKQVFFTPEQTKIGDPAPDFTLSITNNFNIYKNLNVSFQLDGSFGNDVYNATRQFLYRDLLHGDVDNPITIGGQQGAFAAYYNSLYNTGLVNSYFVEDASYVRLRDLTISYDFAKHIGLDAVKSVVFSLTGKNLLTFTNYSGFDPEASSNLNSAAERGLDLNSFPNLRSYQVGLSVSF